MFYFWDRKSHKEFILEKIFDITLQNRKRLQQFLTETSKEKLFKIPEGHRNNIWWNIAHVVVTQQLLVYKFSNLPLQLDDEIIGKYRKGTAPEGIPSDDEIKLINDCLISTVNQLQEDYKNGVFKEFNPYTTSANVTLSSVEDAIAFNAFHEGIHLGTILSLKKH